MKIRISLTNTNRMCFSALYTNDMPFPIMNFCVIGRDKALDQFNISGVECFFIKASYEQFIGL